MEYSNEDFKLAEEYTRISIGMDTFFRSNNEDSEKEFEREGLLPVILTEIQGHKIQSWNRAIELLNDVSKAYDNFSQGYRKEYMKSQVSSTIHLAKSFRDGDYSFLDKVSNFLGIDSDPVDDKKLSDNYLKLKELFSIKYGINTNFNLRKFVLMWEEEFKVKDIVKVGNDYLKKAKNQLLDLGFSEVEDINVSVEMVDNVPYNAYCDYFSDKIYLNSEISHTSFSLKHLAVHEAFPGHSTHLRIRENRIKNQSIPLDASLVFTNTASSTIFEGLAENGLLLLDWIESVDDEIYHLLQIIRSQVTLNAAYKFHVEKLDKEIIIDYLIQHGFGDLPWASSRFKFLSHKFRGPFIYSYWKGQELVMKKLEQLPKERYREFYRHILENMHSASSVKMYK